jgi:hypothetical protein
LYGVLDWSRSGCAWRAPGSSSRSAHRRRVRRVAGGPGLVNVNWLSFRGFRITGARAQGVYADNADGLSLTHLSVSGNGGQGIQIRGRAITVSDSDISANGLAGISELSGSGNNLYSDNTISGNGKDGQPFNGDGIQLNGTAARILANTIANNGDPGIYEHGIYAGSTASDYLIEANTLTGNAASDIKAAGSNGTIRNNQLGDSRFGLVFSDNAKPVSAYQNLIVGTFQHAVFFTTGTTPAKAHLWNNTIVQAITTSSHPAPAAIYIKAAALADIKNNRICYANSGATSSPRNEAEHPSASVASCPNPNRQPAEVPGGHR